MAPERRFALIVANSQYVDPDLQKLIAPAQDAEALANVLQDANIGGFEVKTLLDEPSYKVNEEIQAFFSDRGRDDLLLLYFSCHGIKDEEGQLYFATSNTSRKLLDATAISANFVNRMMFRSRSRRQILLLDCCYSGAFAKGLVSRADKKIHTGDYFEEGRGRIVLTASDSMQYSFEADKLNVEVKDPGSIFTRAVIDGLNTGKADLDKDGRVSYDELYEYTYDRVIDETPLQKPGKWVFGVEGDVIVARNPNWRKGVNNKGPVATAGEQFVTTTTKPKEVTSPKKTQSPLQPTSAVSSPSQSDITNKPISEEKSTPSALTPPVKDFPPASYSSSSTKPEHERKSGLKNPTLLLPILAGGVIGAIIVALIAGGIIHLPGNGGAGVNVSPPPPSSAPPSPPSNNRPPVANAGLDQTVNEKTTVKLDGTKSHDPDGKIIGSYSWIQTSGPHVTLNGANTATPSFVAPSLTSDTSLTFNLTVTDKAGAKNTATVNVTVKHHVPSPSPLPSLPPPTALDQSVTTTQNTPVKITLGGSDPQNPNATLTAAIVTHPMHGTLNTINQDTGLVTYTPNPNFTGADKFTFKVSDGKVDSKNISTVHVTVNQLQQRSPNNHPPMAINQSVTTSMNKPIDITLAGSDIDKSDNLTAAIVTYPIHGTLGTINQDTGLVTYTPNPTFTGT